MFDFALLAKGGADKADRSTAVALDFEVERKRFAFNGHKISIIDSTNQVKIDYCMATNEMKNGCGLSTEALLAGNLKRRCDKRVEPNTSLPRALIGSGHCRFSGPLQVEFQPDDSGQIQ